MLLRLQVLRYLNRGADTNEVANDFYGANDVDGGADANEATGAGIPRRRYRC